MPRKDFMRKIIATPWIVLLGLCASLEAQDKKNPELAQGKPEIVKELVKGSIHHRPLGKEVEWERITGKAEVVNPALLRFSDGTPIELVQSPTLSEKGAKEAAEFLHKLVDDKLVTSFGYVGDTNLEHAMIINGWGLAGHSSLHPAEVIARENKRGFWRDANIPGIAPGKPTDDKPTVIKDRVKGSINHDKGKREWQRITGRVRVIDAHTLEFTDGTRILLHVVAPELGQTGLIGESVYPCGKEAAEFLRKLIGDQPVMCFLVEAQDDKWIGYAGDTNLGHALVINGWGLAHHSSLHPAEITAREKQRGMWRGKFLDPDDWRTGKRLPVER
jgi:endonuclease YncB( thermonuclease family)